MNNGQLTPRITPELLTRYPDQTCHILNRFIEDFYEGNGGGGGGEGNLEDIIQTTTSYDDGGVNIVTAYLSGGTTRDFQIRNGHQGSQGDPGTPGQDGQDATVAVGTTTTLPAGSSATVTNSGTASAAVFNFGIPQGIQGVPGQDGQDGAAATISVGSTTTLPAGSSATVTNSGTSSAAVFDFGIPKGDKGDTGSTGPAGPGVVSGGTTGQVLTKKSGTDYDTEWTTPATYSDFTGATSSVAGTHGLVPAPTTSDPDKFLKGDGTWGTPPGTTYTAGTGIDITGSTIAVDTSAVSMKADYTVKKSYTIDLTAQSTSNFYPVIFPRTQNTIDCEIHSPSYGSVDPYNQNYIHFNACAQGWADLQPRKKLIILQEGAYASNEITIGCIGLGMHGGYTCVWLRGGKNYYFTCNFIAEAHTSTYTINDETFSVGTNYYGGTNTNVEIVRTPNQFPKDVALLEDVDARANLYRYTKSQYNSSSNSWYYPIANLPIDNSNNSSSVIINGRFGGWVNTNMAKIDLLLTNRSDYSGNNVTASGSIKGPYAGALGTTNVVVYKQSNKSAIVYLKCDGYFAFDITADYYQATKSWTGNYTTTPSGTLIWSTATTDALEKVDQNGRISKVREVYNHYTSRPTNANLTATGNGGMFTFQATSAMTTAKPKSDSHILQLEWDNTSGYDSQIAVSNTGNNPWVGIRAQQAGTWSGWTYLLNDTAGSVKTANIDALAVTTAKIADSAITAAKLAPGVVNDATLTITKNGSTLGTFTANASSNVTIDVPDTAGPKGDPGKGCPIGTILPYSGTTLPEGYLACDGTAVSRTTYSDLFSAIGTTYGSGDGSTTFNLPNLKGKVPVGQDTSDTSFDVLGETGGEKTHKLTVSEMPKHTHRISSQRGTPGNSSWDYGQPGTGWNASAWNPNPTEPIGGNGAHNNLQPYIVINYIIKFKDLPNTVAEVKDQYSSSATDVYSANYVNSVIPTVNDATLTVTQNGSTLGTFSANASSNVTIDIPGGGGSGGGTFTTLWTNSNTNTEFANKTVTIANLSTYKFIDILVIPYRLGNQNTIHVVRHYYDATRNRGEISQPFRYNNARFYGSRIFTVNAGSVAFDYAYNDANVRANDWYIPWKIIGYK